MYPHRIHLRGPWEFEPLAHAGGGPLPPPGRLTLPATWTAALGAFAGTVRFRRRFQQPRRIDPWERLWIVCAGANRTAAVSLNGTPLGRHVGAFAPFAYPVTPLIRPRNELVIDVEGPAGGGLWGVVALEVRREAFLSDLRLWATFPEGVPTLHVAGAVVDEVARPLEVYVLLDNVTVHYAALPAGPFAFAVPVPDAPRWQPAGFGEPRLCEVRVELIEGASRLDVQARPFGFREVDAAGRVNGHAVEAPVVELSEPAAAAASLDHADAAGRPVRLRLPAGEEAALVPWLMHHPAVLGWVGEP
jgi:hypothetical protein